jgi:hypothetical protein
MVQKERAEAATNSNGSGENLEVGSSNLFGRDYSATLSSVQSQPRLDAFFGVFFSNQEEEIRLRAFKAKNAPDAPDNYPIAFGITRAQLANDVSLRQHLKDLNSTRGLYFVVNAGGDGDADIKRFNAWFVESDDLSIEEQHKLLTQSPMPPSIIVQTRKSLHAYWPLAGDCDNQTWSEIQRRLINYFHGDKANKNPSRLMRLPYFDHLFFNEETGRIERKRVELVWFDAAHRYTAEEMRATFPIVVEPQAVKYAAAQPADAGKALMFTTGEELNAELKRRVMRHPTARMNGDGWFHCQGVCHDGNGDTAVMFNPATGAVKCMAGCSYKDLLRAFGLPEQPFSASSAFSAERDPEASAALPELDPKALHGLAGDVVRTLSPHTEADDAAILIQLLTAFGNIIGRTAYFSVEAARHYLNLFVVLIGATSKGRKGTSWGQVNRLAKNVDDLWASNCIKSGLSSGEGLIWAVRDPIERQEPIKEKGRITGYQTNVVDAGVDDKRLLVLEAEFASVLRVMARETNTLSAIIRQAWDDGGLRVMTKNSPAQATGVHISIIGHITKDELRRNLEETETANGFANRFLWTVVRRSKLLPEGGSLSDRECNPLVERLHDAVTSARRIAEMHRDGEARTLWFKIYEELSGGHAGLLGAVTSRAEAQVMRLACLYALLDFSGVIRRVHLEAALVLWHYCEASAHHVFGNATGDRVADEMLRALRESGEQGLTQTALNNLFSGHQKKGSMGRALSLLQEQGCVACEKEETGGRPSLRWFAVTSKAEKAEEAEKGIGKETFSASSAFSASVDSTNSVIDGNTEDL